MKKLSSTEAMFKKKRRLKKKRIHDFISQPAFTCSKLTIEILEQVVYKYVLSYV